MVARIGLLICRVSNRTSTTANIRRCVLHLEQVGQVTDIIVRRLVQDQWLAVVDPVRLVSYLRLSFYFLRSFGPLFEYVVRVGACVTVRHLQASIVQLLIQWPLRFERVLRNVLGLIVDFLDFYVDVLIKLGIIGNAWYARWRATLRTAILGLAEDEVVRVQYCLLIQRRRPRSITL